MGVEFGELPVRIRRVVYYSLTPFEQKSWVKFLSHSTPNLFMRALRALPTTSPVFILAGWMVTWSVAEHKRVNRKDPTLYENDS